MGFQLPTSTAELIPDFWLPSVVVIMIRPYCWGGFTFGGNPGKLGLASLAEASGPKSLRKRRVQSPWRQARQAMQAWCPRVDGGWRWSKQTPPKKIEGHIWGMRLEPHGITCELKLDKFRNLLFLFAYSYRYHMHIQIHIICHAWQACIIHQNIVLLFLLWLPYDRRISHILTDFR